MQEENIYLAPNIEYLRKEKKETQQELADVFGYVYTTIGNWEKGIRIPSASDLLILSKHFNIAIEDLMSLNLKTNNVHNVVRVVLYLPTNIHFLRNKNNLTKNELASYLGYTGNLIDDLENGHKRADLYDVSKLSKIFNVSTDDLLHKDLSKNEKYTKEETKEKITKILDNSDLEEDKKIMMNTMVSMVCDEKESV